MQGTYEISVTVQLPADSKLVPNGYLTLKCQPGTSEGFTPPKDMEDALEQANKWSKSIASNYNATINEIRITTFEQGGPEDPLTEQDENFDEEEERYFDEI